MSDDKGFRKMNELVDTLRNAESGLRNGTLGIADLDRACNDARELYERLVVLRHKAREGAITKGSTLPRIERGAGSAPSDGNKGQEQVRPVVTAPTPTPAPAPAPPKASEPVINVPLAEVPAMKLDTRPQDIRQTSLIEAIADTEKEEAPVMKTASEFLREASAAKAAAGKTAPTVAEKLERAHIDDLGKAISVSHKFWFTAELFNGDRSAFDKAIARLNSAKDFEDASSWFNSEVLPILKKGADPEAKTAFLELIQRRFA